MQTIDEDSAKKTKMLWVYARLVWDPFKAILGFNVNLTQFLAGPFSSKSVKNVCYYF